MRTVFDMTFEEEKAYNNPLLVFEPLTRMYVNTVDKNGTKLYQHLNQQWYNTKLIKQAAQHFKKYGIYTDIDPKADPAAYKEFWDRWEYRREYGMTLPIVSPPGGGISDKDLINTWIPGVMVGHLNFGPIVRTKEDDDYETTKAGTINKYDALKGAIEVAERKSNFELLDELFKSIADKEVKDTTIDFPDFWDTHYNFWIADMFAQKMGLDISVFKARRKGMSYIAGWDAFNDYDLIPRSFTLIIAYDSKYLTDKTAIFSMIKTYSDHVNKHTDWRKRRISNSESQLVSGFRYEKSDVIEGFQSTVLAVSARDNSDCGRGKRATKVKYEESGTFPNLIQTQASTKSTNESGGYVVGHSTYWATASTKDADFGPFSKIHRLPASFDCMAFKEDWEVDKSGLGRGMVFPNQASYEGAIDEHGNSLVQKALEMHEIRADFKQKTLQPEEFRAWQVERFTKPSQVLNVAFNNIFARKYGAALNRQLERLEEPEFIGRARYGLLQREQGGKIAFLTEEQCKQKNIKWHPPITDDSDFLPKDHDPHGCIIEYESPHTYLGEDGQLHVPNRIYYAIVDPYATNKHEKDVTMRNSMGATYIFEAANTVTPTKGQRLVASWIGRPHRTDDYNDQLFLLAERYNARIFFENDRGDTYEYAVRKNKTHMLVEEPELMSMKELRGTTGRVYGISIGKNIGRKAEGARRFSDTLGLVVGKNSEGGDVLFLEYIFCKKLIRQLLAWNHEGNFDCVSAMIVLSYLLQSLLDEIINPEDVDDYGYATDDFFERSHF